MKFLPQPSNLRSNRKQIEAERKLIDYEAKLTQELFGPVPKGHNRKFFCLDVHVWVWHEQWKDNQNKDHNVLTRYVLRKDGGIIKSQNNSSYRVLDQTETINLIQAIKQYIQIIQDRYSSLMS
jgi:hypothetical protein